MNDEQSKVSILLVDDRPEKLLALESVLEDLGQRLVRASSGREALRQVLAQDFAVILLDINMPGMDGFETAELIRNRKSSEHIPIIFITAFGDEFHMARGYSLGAVDYIAAPVIPEVLRSKVSVFVDLYRKTEQVKRQADSLRRRASQLQGLAAASLAINAARSVEKMLQTVTDTAAELICTQQAITLFVDPRSGRSREPTQAFSCFSDKYAEFRARPLRLDRLTDTLVYRSHSASRMSQTELLEHPDWEIVREVAVPPVVGGMLACPLMGRDGTRMGIIYLTDPLSGAFTSDDEVLVVQLAQVAAVAIENALFAEERETNRLKDEFLCTLSHELRTPLNAILGWTQILRREGVEGDVGHALEVIERNARAQTKLIEDMLDVSRITTGKLRMSLADVTLAPIISASVDVIAPAAQAKNIRIEVDLPAEPVWLKADTDRLQQVAWNLLTNAVKFTPSGGRVQVRAEVEAGEAVVRVIDTGRGISPSFLPHVFDAFRQADSTSTRSHGGLGIGLTIVRHIVEMHGGTVSAQCEHLGAGATFIVRLPVAASGKRSEPEQDVNGSPRQNCLAEAQDLKGMRVLIVDDDDDARGIVRQILIGAGATVETCGSAAEALDALVQFRPDVMLSDIAMPEMDGYGLVQAVRQLSADAGGATPVIALTAYARSEDRAKALTADFQAHLSKPIDPSELLRVVRLCAANALVVGG